MSYDGLTVNHAGLDNAANELLLTVSNMDKALDSLETDIKQDVMSWKGAENGQRAAYDAAKFTWDMAIHELKDLLDASAQTTYNANADYKNADLRGADRFIK